MPSVKHIAKARQRYAMVPVLDEDGNQKTVPVINAKTGQPKTARGGRPVTRKLTREDRDNPLPPRHCDYPACPEPDKVIAIGTPFKCLSIKQQFGGRELFRHESCPSWNPWEYSNSLSARISQIQSMDLGSDGWEGEDDPGAAAEEVASAIEELADEKEEAGQNMEDGFGHETSASAELKETAEGLREWASQVRDVTLPDFPDDQCLECEGTGSIGDGDEATDCEQCGGEGTAEPSEEQLDAWREEAEQAIQDELGNSPV